MRLSLKLRSILFVGLSALILLTAYFFVSGRYIRQTTDHLLAERIARSHGMAQEIDAFLTRGGGKLVRIAALPALVFGLQTLDSDRPGRQIAAAEPLHYVFLDSDIFTAGVFLLNREGKILWSEPPDMSLLDTTFSNYPEVWQDLSTIADRPFALTLIDSIADSRILVSVPLNGEDVVGALVGAIPLDHPALIDAIGRQMDDGSIAQVIDSKGLVAASTDQRRILRELPYWHLVMGSPTESAMIPFKDSVVSFAPIGKTAWTVTLDRDRSVAMADVNNLRRVLTGFAIFFIVLTVAVIYFVVHTFANPIAMLTADARRIAGGDLDVRFSLGRTDELGILASALEEMKSRLKSSYERLLISEKMSLMGQIVAGIAHELNNPLTIVMGHTELLLDRNTDPALTRPLGRIRDGAERASKIVRNLLTFARQQKPERKATDLNSVIMKTVDLRVYDLRVSNIELITELSPLPQTMADAQQLQQVFLNLLVNAEQAMLEANGGGRLTITSSVEDDRIKVVFQDNGPGISAENLRRIFDPFFTTKIVGKGTGLGLSICEGIVAEHGGQLTASTSPGSGAKFEVELPVISLVHEPAPLVVKATAIALRKKVLIVDDEGHLRELLQDILSQEGHRIQTARNGKEALELIRREAFDLVITDIKMPETDGIELYRVLKSEGSELCKRLLFITGDLMNTDTLRFLESCNNPWIAKPFELPALREAVNKALSPNGNEVSNYLDR